MATIRFITCNRWPHISQPDTIVAEPGRYFTVAPKQAIHFAKVIDAQLG